MKRMGRILLLTVLLICLPVVLKLLYLLPLSKHSTLQCWETLLQLTSRGVSRKLTSRGSSLKFTIGVSSLQLTLRGSSLELTSEGLSLHFASRESSLQLSPGLLLEDLVKLVVMRVFKPTVFGCQARVQELPQL